MESANAQLYREILRERFTDIQRRRRRYSIRAFARDLGVSHTLIANLLAGRGGFSSERVATKVADALKLDPRETSLFLLSFRLQHAKSDDLREILEEKIAATRRPPTAKDVLSPRELDRLCEPEMFHAYTAMDLAKWDGSTSSLARLVGETETKTKKTLRELERLGLIRGAADGGWTKTLRRPVIASEEANLSLQRLHAKMMTKAIGALRTQSNQEKFVGSETLAVNRATYLEIRRILETALDAANSASEDAESPDQVYHLNVQLFRLGGPPYA